MSTDKDTKKADKEVHNESEFGGTFGAVTIILFSHFILYYLFISLHVYDGSLFLPWMRVEEHIQFICDKMAPNLETFAVYLTFMAMQTIFAWFLPGFKVEGLPVPSLNGEKLVYNCNGYSSWWLTQITMALLHYNGIFRIQWIAQNMGPLITIMIIFSDVVAVLVYCISLATGCTLRMSGNHLYDFFMGAVLNPRVGSLDIKMWAEVRVSWITLYLMTLSAAVNQYQQLGYLTSSMTFMLVSHWLYTNACCKGEEMIPSSWDIFYEKWGWMLCFWNLAGVPIMYCWNSFYILRHQCEMSTFVANVVFLLLVVQYYIWDTANSQKCSLRMIQRGTYKERPWYIFPKLPWKVLENPKTIKTESGSALLVDGWYQYARKMHYTMDVLLGLMWGVVCGTKHFLPYWYFVFFTIMIVDRWRRDDKRCSAKYGGDWEKYKKEVPYVFIPYVF